MLWPASAVRTFPAARRDLTSPDATVRASAARDLGSHLEQHPEAIPALVAALADDAAADVRVAAAVALADGQAHTAQEALVRAVSQDEDDEVRQMALMALGEVGDADATTAVARCLCDRVASVRFQAVIAYPRLCPDRKKAVAALLAATRDDDPRVCHIALRMAEELGPADNQGGLAAEPAIVRRAAELLAHEAAIVRVAAAIVRARSGERDAEPVLLAVARGEVVTDEAEDEAAAIELCGDLGLTEATAALERRGFGGVLGLRADRFAWQARVALAALGHERARRWILSELGAWTRARRSMAVAAATRARLRAALPAIRAMQGDSARADPDAVQEAVRALLEHDADPIERP